MTKQVYLAGGCLTKAEQMLREAEKKDIKGIGLDLYVPQDNKSINDKSKVDNNGLAERIVKADTDAIFESDIAVIEVQPHYLGTITELGQMKGIRDFANMVLKIADEQCDNSSPAEILNKIVELAERNANKKVMPHCEDVRRFPSAGVDEVGDRRSFSVNAYVYGVCLDLSDGKGFYEWNEVLEELKRIKKDPSTLI